MLHFGGQAFGPSAAAVSAVPGRYDEAARLLGAPRWRRWWRIDLRLMAPGLTAAGGLVLLSVLKELPATLMLRPIGFDTLPTPIAGTVDAALLVDAGELSLVLVALFAVLTWVLVIRRMGHRPDRPDVAMPFVDVGELRMHYDEHGPVASPVVLLHGGGGSVDDDVGGWAGLIPSFAEHHRVIAVDHRGHGRRTTRPARRPSSRWVTT